MREAVPHMGDAEGGVATFVRVQLRAAGKDEHFLEKLLGAHPELLALDPRDTDPRKVGRLSPALAGDADRPRRVPGHRLPQ